MLGSARDRPAHAVHRGGIIGLARQGRLRLRQTRQVHEAAEREQMDGQFGEADEQRGFEEQSTVSP
jgi:hypothetical protein